ERKEAEKQIAHLASFPELNPNPVLELDPAGEVTYANPALSKILERDGLGTDPRVFLPPDFQEILPQILEGDVQREMYLGQRIYLLTISLTPGINTIRIYTRDITDRKRMEEELRESEEKYRTLIERAHDGITIIQEGRIMFANPRAADLWGGPIEEVTGTSFINYVHPDERGRIVARYERRLKGEEISQFYETVLVRKDGSTFPAELNAGLINYEGGPADLIIIRDITERRRAEEALMQSQAKLTEAMDLAKLANWDFDVQTGIFTFNDRFYALYGTTAEREGGYRMPAEVYAREFCHPDDMHLVADEVRKAIETPDPGYTHQLEHRIIRRDGEIRYINVRIAITKDEHGKTVKTHGANQDITDRKRMEEAIRESESRYREFFTTSRDAVFITSPSGEWIDFNDAAVELFGYDDREDLRSRSIGSLYEDPEERKAFISLIVEKGFVKEYPVRLRRRDASIIDSLITAVPLRGNDGAVTSFVGSIRDITERKRMEKDLLESEERYRGVIESQTEFITRFAPDATVTFVNDAYLKYFGLSREKIIGKKFKPEIPEEDRGRVRGHFAALTREHPVGLIEHRIVMPDGQVRWQRWSDRAIFDEEGNLVEYQSVGRDTTDQKQAAEALRESEARLDAVVRGSPIPQFVIGRDHRVVYWNRAIEELTGVRASEMIGTTRQWSAFYLEERPLMADLLVDGSTRDIDHYYQGKYSPSRLIDGAFEAVDLLPGLGESGKWLSFTAAPIHDSRGEIIGAIETLEDITERKRAEDELRESEEKYRNLVELASTGIAIIQDGVIEYVNRELSQIWGGSPDELIRVPLSGLVHPDEEKKVLDRYRKRIAGEPVPSVYETVFLRRDGSSYPAEIHAGLINYRRRPADLVLVQDITERKRAVRALQESQERYRQIVEGTNAGVWVLDNELTTIYANDQMASMLGTLPPEMLGRSISDFVFPEDRAEVNEIFARIGNGLTPEAELRFRRKDQVTSWLRAAAGPIYDVQGQRVGFTGIFSDVTKNRLAEQAVKQAEEKYRNIFEFAVEGIYQINTKGRFIASNPAMARILGFESVDELLLGVTDTAAQLWADPGQRREYLERLRDEGQVNGFEAEYFRKDGSRIWVSLSTRAVKGPDGKIVYSEGTLEDITQRKKALQALRESEEMFRNPVEQSPVGVFLIQDGVVLYVNPRLAAMGGFSRDDLLAKPFAAFVHPDDRAKVGEAMARLLNNEAPSASVQYRSLKRDGGYLEMEAYGSSMIFQGRPAIYGTIIDVTERKRMEDQIGKSLKEKEVLLREIHHRVKNNMQVISSLLSVQSQNIRDNEVKGLFKESQNRIRSIALVHELLYRSDNLDQIEYGAYLKKMFVPLFESYSVDQRKVSMSIDAPKVMITIDKAVPCSLIVNELISNSLKHAFPGDRKGAITIRFGLDAAKGEYVLEYADDGVGLPPGLDVRTLNTL
ncbi:MAG TPA: PAS domain S-box protein, partial [Methanomicrobiales archaeon]|nr:PAS domain S-box protein [Methanomicrobiales archaeon]